MKSDRSQGSDSLALRPSGFTGSARRCHYSSASGNASSSAGFVFTQNLTLGIREAEVQALQHYLNTHGFPVVSIPSYAGSLGFETQYFGASTQTALAKFQKSVGIKPAIGYFGPVTRAYVNAHP